MRIEVEGDESIKKIVKAQGNSGRIYLPVSWVGREVLVVLLKECEKDEEN